MSVMTCKLVVLHSAHFESVVSNTTKKKNQASLSNDMLYHTRSGHLPLTESDVQSIKKSQIRLEIS